MRVKRPNAILYFFIYILFYPFLKIFFRLKIDRKGFDVPEGAYIVLSNHFTVIDFMFVMLSLYPKRMNAVTAHKYFLVRPLHKFLPMVGCIPKNMFDPDIRSIVEMKTVLKRGDKILLFPEGRCSISQAYSGMHKSTGKLIKKFGVPVVSGYIEGAKVCMHHWRRWVRFGRVKVTYRNLFSADDVKSLSIDEINAAIDARLSGDEGVLPPKKPFQTFLARRLAEGLHQLLYYCPKCKQEFTMETEGNMIRCNACGNAATMDKESKLTPTDGSIAEKDISSWFREQVRHEMKSVNADMQPIITKVKVQMPSPIPGEGVVERGSGTMSLDPKGWYFDGVLNGEHTGILFPVDALPAISFHHYTNFQIYYGGEYYVFVPEDRRKCLKYVVLTECVHWKFASHPLLTPGKNSGFVDTVHA